MDLMMFVDFGGDDGDNGILLFTKLCRFFFESL